MKRITSRQNPLVGRYRSIALGEVADLMLLDGPHLVADALAAGILLRQVALTAEALGRPEVRAIVARLVRDRIEMVTAAQPVMAALSPVRSSSVIVAIADRPSGDDTRPYAGSAPLLVIACDVQDPGNVGAIVRVAEAGGATGVVAAGTCADPFGWKALRGSMGSALRLPIAIREHVDQAVAQARHRDCRVVATVPRGGRSLFDVDLTGAVAILIGGEGAGLSPSVVDAADLRVTVPMAPPVDSLNAAVTAALLVYEARRRRTQNPEPSTAPRTQNPEPRTT
jgi:TrmH family RNA methyltransferase